MRPDGFRRDECDAKRQYLCHPAADGGVVGEGISMGHLTYPHQTQSANPAEGFSLLEMMMVVTLILIVASIATPIYTTVAVRAREAVLRDDLFTLRALIDRFTLDNGRPPARLDELVQKGYLGRLPTDPFTGSNETWQVEKEDGPLPPEQSAPGIADVHSGSHALSLEGTPYSSW
jgi:general secretion pathway protein G